MTARPLAQPGSHAGARVGQAPLQQHQRAALLSGGTRGIGQEIARRLVSLSKPLVLTARTTDAGALLQLEQQLHSAAPGHAAPAHPRPHPHTPEHAGHARPGRLPPLTVLDGVDLAVPQSAQQVAGRLGATKLDLLINNAACHPPGWSRSDLDLCLRTNFLGPLALTHALLASGSLVGGAPPGHATHQEHSSSGGGPPLVVMVSSQIPGALHNRYPQAFYAIRTAPSLEALLGLATAAVMEGLCPALAEGLAHPQRAPQGHAPHYALSKAMLNRAVELLACDPSELLSPGTAAALCRAFHPCPAGPNGNGHHVHAPTAPLPAVLAVPTLAPAAPPAPAPIRLPLVVGVCPGWCRTRLGGKDLQAIRSPEQGAESVLWAVDHYFEFLDKKLDASGGLWRDGCLVPFYTHRT